MLKNFVEKIKIYSQNSKVLKVLKNRYFLVTLFFLVWILFVDSNNLFNWYSGVREVAKQERKKEYYKNAIKHTEDRLKELSSNKDSLEKFAREQYLFHTPDEEIFIVKEVE
jgi:Septum formation initiator.